jgi:twinkle protein
VKPASHWKKEVRDSFFAPAEKQGAYLPWVKTHHLIRIRKGEVSLWPGVTHHGKSLATSQVALALCNQGERVCIASMEMKPVATMRRMTRQAANARSPRSRT